MKKSKFSVNKEESAEFLPCITSTSKPDKHLRNNECLKNLTFENEGIVHSTVYGSSSCFDSNQNWEELSAVNFENSGLDQTINPSFYKNYSVAGTNDLDKFAEYHQNIATFTQKGPARIILDETTLQTDYTDKTEETLGYLDNEDHDIEIYDELINENPNKMYDSTLGKNFIEIKKKLYKIDKKNPRPAVEKVDINHRSQLSLNVETSNKNVKLKANRMVLTWVGVCIKGDAVKKTLICYEAAKTLEMKISVQQIEPFFFITDAHGSTNLTKLIIRDDPKKHIPLYLKFYPKHTGYCTAVVNIDLYNKRFQLKLFGYASSGYLSFVNPLNLPMNSPTCNNATMVSQCQLNVDNLDNVPVRLKNLGSRAIYVVCFSADTNINPISPLYMHGLKDGDTECIQVITLSFKNYVTSVNVDFMYADVDLIKTAHLINNQPNRMDLNFQDYYNRLMDMGFINCVNDKNIQFENFVDYIPFDFRNSFMEQVSKNLVRVKFNLCTRNRQPTSTSVSTESQIEFGKRRDTNSSSWGNSASRVCSDIQYMNDDDGVSVVSSTCMHQLNKLCKHMDKGVSLLDAGKYASSDDELELKDNTSVGMSRNDSIEKITIPLSKVTLDEVTCGQSSFGCFIINNKTRETVRYRVYGLEMTTDFMNFDSKPLSKRRDIKNQQRIKCRQGDGNDVSDEDESIFSLVNVPSMSARHANYAVIFTPINSQSPSHTDLAHHNNGVLMPVLSGEIKPRHHVSVVVKFSPLHSGTFCYSCKVFIEPYSAASNAGAASAACMKELVKFVDVTCTSRDAKPSWMSNEKVFPVSIPFSNLSGIRLKAIYKQNRLLWTIQLKNTSNTKLLVYIRFISVKSVSGKVGYNLNNLKSHSLKPNVMMEVTMYESENSPIDQNNQTYWAALIYNTKGQYVYLPHEYLKD